MPRMSGRPAGRGPGFESKPASLPRRAARRSSGPSGAVATGWGRGARGVAPTIARIGAARALRGGAACAGRLPFFSLSRRCRDHGGPDPPWFASLRDSAPPCGCRFFRRAGCARGGMGPGCRWPTRAGFKAGGQAVSPRGAARKPGRQGGRAPPAPGREGREIAPPEAGRHGVGRRRDLAGKGLCVRRGRQGFVGRAGGRPAEDRGQPDNALKKQACRNWLRKDDIWASKCHQRNGRGGT